MAQQVKTITSEALEAAYRSLTPSQDGFTEDLMASNTIIPVLDLTANAEGTATPEYLQNAIAYGSQTAFDVGNTTTTIANTPGFYRVVGCASCISAGGVTHEVSITMTDGVTPKIVWELEVPSNASSTVNPTENIDFVFFVDSGISLNITTNSTKAKLVGSIRQVADVNGNPVLPSGFSPQ